MSYVRWLTIKNRRETWRIREFARDLDAIAFAAKCDADPFVERTELIFEKRGTPERLTGQVADLSDGSGE